MIRAEDDMYARDLMIRRSGDSEIGAHECYFNCGEFKKSVEHVHAVLRHISIELFAVLLFLGLDVVKCLSRGGIGELKHAYVIERGGVLLGGEHIGAEELIDLA